MKFKYLFFALIIVVLGITVFTFITGKAPISIIDDEEFNRDLGKEDMNTFTLSIEDSLLIAPDFQNKITNVKVFNSKFRNPVATLSIDGYTLIIYKFQYNIDSIKNIHFDSLPSDKSTGYSYRIIDEPYFQYRFRTAKIPMYKNIFTSLKGDSLRTKDGSNYMYFQLLCENFSVRYESNSPVDILVKGNTRSFKPPYKIPMNVLFLKKNNNIYLLTLTATNSYSEIPDDLILKIVSLKDKL